MSRDESQYSMDFDPVSPRASSIKDPEGAFHANILETKGSGSGLLNDMSFAEIDSGVLSRGSAEEKSIPASASSAGPSIRPTKPDPKIITGLKIDPSKAGPASISSTPTLKVSPVSPTPPVSSSSRASSEVVTPKPLVSQSLPVGPIIVATSTPAIPAPPPMQSRINVRADPLVSVLMNKPFVDVGLNFALGTIDRIAGQAGMSSGIEAMQSLSGNISGGGSYYGSLELQGKTGLPLQYLNHPTSNKIDNRKQTDARQGYDAVAGDKNRFPPAEPPLSRGQDNRPHLIPSPSPSPARDGNGDVKREKASRSIAGFVSEPWRSTGPRDASQPPPVEFAATLVTAAVQGTTTQPLPSSLAPCLDDQRKSRHFEELTALAPALKTLLTKKVLSPLKAEVKSKRNINKSTRRSQESNGGGGGNEELLLTDCLELAATEAELKAALDAQIKAQLQAARSAVQEKLNSDRRNEQALEDRIAEFSEKTFEARRRIKVMQSSKGSAHAAKEEDKAAYREQMLREQAAQRALKAEESRKLAQERKEAITRALKEKNATMETAVFTKLAESTQAITAKAQMRADVLADRASKREEELKKKLEYAAQVEHCKTSERAASLHHKDDKYERVKVEREQSTEQQVAAKRTKEIAAAFRAEQRRNMLDIKRKAEQELGRIRQTAEAVVASSRHKANAERTIKLNRIYADQLRKQIATGGLAEPLQVTPGPGEYFKNLNHDIKPGGGYMASSRPESIVSEIPGPGTYEAVADSSGGSGCIPFMGRGKTDVDWTILRASKLPGVGQYAISGKGKSGRAIKLNGKGTSQLDTIIERAKRLPGPGDYTLSHDASHRPGGLESYLLGESEYDQVS